MIDPGPARRRRASFLLAAALAGAIGAGLLLRLWKLPDQVVADDEMHAVRAALRHPAGRLATTYGLYAYCLPLTALDRLVMDRGAPLTETVVRAPVVTAGLLLLAAVPLWTAKTLRAGGIRGEEAAVWAAWLTALSPLLVLHGRWARSYGPMVLLTTLALAAFWAWWRDARGRWAPVYVACASLAAWVNLLAAPLVAAPLLFAGAEWVFRRPRGTGRTAALAGLAATALGLAAGVALFLIPARSSLERLLAHRAREVEWSPEAWLGALQMLAGPREAWLAALFWGVALWGFRTLWTADRRLARFTLLPVAVQSVALFVLGPTSSHAPEVLSRYLLPALPLVLFWTAVALTKPFPGTRRQPGARRAVGVLLLGALVLAGPFGDPALWRSPFMHHRAYFTVHAQKNRLPESEWPRIYRRILPELPPGSVLEVPWHYAWHHNDAYRIYQEGHGRDVIAGASLDWIADPRIGFRTVVAASPEAFVASDARFVLVHLDYPAEEARVERLLWPPRAGLRPAVGEHLRRLGRRLAGTLRTRWGPPDFTDGTVLLWDLERIRSTAGRSGG